jgi:hypothetical protein
MDPNHKLVLDDLGQRFDDHDAKWERCFADFHHECIARDVFCWLYTRH